jgi:hypothetical protein
VTRIHQGKVWHGKSTAGTIQGRVANMSKMHSS